MTGDEMQVIYYYQDNDGEKNYYLNNMIIKQYTIQ
ncbi:hypothetical protein CHRY9393_01599 [Chryseobacterium fistulae]|uniref:Uncharacterized protein n=1 Tax=Chryseobacterium fistulae TaxID=2675058 RepID=A0A6N4XRI0_9FLAO|nr:hypothetical protein CHRY9393_01599 [Chryseobacterium fistulae]